MGLLQHATGQEIENLHSQDQGHVQVNDVIVTNTEVQGLQVPPHQETVAEMTVTKKIATLLHVNDIPVHHPILVTGKVAGMMMETERDLGHVHQCHHGSGMVIGRIHHPVSV